MTNLQNENRSLKLDIDKHQTKISQKNQEIDQLLVLCRALKDQLQFQVDKVRIQQQQLHAQSTGTFSNQHHTVQSAPLLNGPSVVETAKQNATISHTNPSMPIVKDHHSSPISIEQSKDNHSREARPIPKLNSSPNVKQYHSIGRLSQTLPVVPESMTDSPKSDGPNSATEIKKGVKISKLTRSMSPEFREYFRRSQEFRNSSNSSVGSRSRNFTSNENEEQKAGNQLVGESPSLLDEKPSFILQDVQNARNMLSSLDNQIKDLEHLFQ
jgi:hypothetical protein